MPNSLSLDANGIAALLQQEVKPIFLLGAGASVKSGIPLSASLVELIARFTYCKVHNRNPDDPTLMRSDWIRWLEQQSWYQADASPASLYPLAVENLLQPQSNRKEFFQRVLKPNVPPSEGYQRLANLLARHMVRTVLTTNFDNLVVQTATQIPAVRHVEEIITESDHTLFRTNPSYPQVIYLHGSVRHYTDKNLIKETQELDPNLVNLLYPLLRDHPLVVMGYRGIEPSIVRHLLIDQAGNCRNFAEGIYWCHLAGTDPVRDSNLVAELSATIGGNLQFIEIEGFDELMRAVDISVSSSQADAWFSTSSIEPPTPVQVNDLQASALDANDLNEPLLRTKLIEYASAMRMQIPTLNSAEKLWGAMQAQNLALTVDGERKATKGGQLLFAKSKDQQIKSAQILVEVSGPAGWVEEVLDNTKSDKNSDQVATESTELTGDLWSQLDHASNLLSRVNRPIRIKGAISQTAYPYPPLALKELLTNLLAHRDYQVASPAILRITKEEIRFENPGGLVESVRGQLEEETIQQVMGEGRRQLKGYRNPVIADFFFSAGAMDKEGSGLPDVIKEATNNLNEVLFGPSVDNSTFSAVIRCRPEALLVDEDTKTARTKRSELRYSPNLLSVIEWPEHVQKLGSIANYTELRNAERNHTPPFGAFRGWIWTFSDLTCEYSKLLLDLCLSEERYEVSTQELLNDPDVSQVLPRLLNTALATYLKSLGLIVRFEAGRLRAYYPSHEGNAREISYRSAFRQSKRTVSKPIVSKTTGKVVYWEHKAVSLRFERFDSEWALALLPGYIFTIDGHSQPIASERIGPLSTRRAARDYNPSVLHDLVFWSRMLATEKESDFTVPLSFGVDPPLLRVASMIPTFVFQEAIESGIIDDSASQVSEDRDIDEIQEEIEQAIANSADDMDR